MEEFIFRKRQLDKVQPFIGKQVIKVFTGQRRVGKSYMMKQLRHMIATEEPDTHIIAIDKEKSEFDHIRDYQHLLRHVNALRKKGKNALFIDEIQDIRQFEKALRSLYSEPGMDIYCTGSNAHMLSGELATYLSGRYVELPIHALTYLEFLEFHQLDNGPAALQQYLKFGGLPYLKHLPLEDEVIFDYLSNIYQTILFRDVIKRHNLRNIDFLENLVHYLSDHVGSIVSGKKISDYLKSQQVKISVNVVLDYLNHLTNAFFVYKTRRAEVGGKKVFEVGDKFFFEDIGLRNVIAGYRPGDIHKVLENVIFSHLKAHGYDVTVGVLGAREIDFVAEKSAEKIYIQACYQLQDQDTIDREFGNLLAIKDQYPKMVVTLDDYFGKNTYQGVAHMHLIKFLTEFT